MPRHTPLHLVISALALLAIGGTGPTDPKLPVAEPAEKSAARRAFQLHAAPLNGAVRLEWTLPPNVKASRALLYRTDAPNSKAQTTLADLDATAREYLDSIPNWTPRYYRVEAVDAAGKRLLSSDLVAAVARPSSSAARVETFAFWYEPYKPSTDPEPSSTRIGDAAFVIGPGFEAAKDLKSLGKGLLPYVTFYQTAGWAGSFPYGANPAQVAAKIAPVGFYRKTIHFPGGPAGYLPAMFSRLGNAEYNPKAVQYVICPNSAPFRDMVLAHTRQQLDNGAIGFFVDNGYEDDIAANEVCESSEHTHYYGDELTSADAFLGLLLEVECEVKKRNPAGVLMVNGGVPAASRFYGLALGDVCDGQLWESYLRSSYSTPREHVRAWEGVYRRSVESEKAARSVPPRRMFVLSYPWNRQEAFFCYATAKLCDLPWSANLGDIDPKHTRFGGHFGTYPELINLRLGRPVQEQEYGGRKQGNVYTREYERGMVAVNPSKTAVTATVPFGQERRYRDVFEKKDAQDTSVTATLPAESGRVYLWR